MLEGYGGVILADVVGLGKSIIASWWRESTMVAGWLSVLLL